MAEKENGSKVHENPFHRMKEHLLHGAHRVAHFRHPAEDPSSPAGTSQISETTTEGKNIRSNSNVEDFPYDSSREDGFTSELSAGAVDDDGIPSPRSQCSTLSMDTLHSAVSGISWTSTQKTIGGEGVNEGRSTSQEVLGPYKHNSDEPILEGVPTDYEDYINDKKAPRSSSHSDGSHSAGNPHHERSSSTSSERSAPDSLYADLSSVSDRDIQVPESVVKADSMGNGDDSEVRAAPPSHPSHVQEHFSNLCLHSST
ncbi:unnamed protein product [Calypogeia fissa]